MYYYSTVNDIVTSHSDIIERGGFDFVDLHFERPSETGFDFLDMTLPGLSISKAYGFSDDDINRLKRYATNNEALLWEFARAGGGENA